MSLALEQTHQSALLMEADHLPSAVGQDLAPSQHAGLDEKCGVGPIALANERSIALDRSAGGWARGEVEQSFERTGRGMELAGLGGDPANRLPAAKAVLGLDRYNEILRPEVAAQGDAPVGAHPAPRPPTQSMGWIEPAGDD